MGINDTWYLSCPESPNSLIFTKFCRLHVMARGNFYENNGTTIMDHIAIDKSTNNHKRSDSASSPTPPSSGNRLKKVSDSNYWFNLLLLSGIKI